MIAGVSSGDALALDALELASGLPFGSVDDAPPLPVVGGSDVEAALESGIRRGLMRPPCLVPFSGGRDSSLILALAVGVARRDGLHPPIPATLVFPGVRSAEESAWQRLVVRHLGLRDWERIEIAEELDLLGDIAVAGLKAHGLLWPCNAHMLVPIFERAHGGSVITGVDGDGLFDGWRWARAQAVLHARVRPRVRDVFGVGLALAPAVVRRWRLAREFPAWLEWLRAPARSRLHQQLSADAASEPWRWDRRLHWYWRRRYLRLCTHSLNLLASDRHVEIHYPLLDPGFLSALARRGGIAGYSDRTAALSKLFADLLPAQLLQRRTKGEFTGAVWCSRSREFAQGWTGRGLDAELVDPAQLQAAWLVESAPGPAATPLQAAWLAGYQAAAVRDGV